jgi:hypothetical protein
MKFNVHLAIILFSLTLPLQALELITDDELEKVTGQDGVSLSGELSFNENGGPLTDSIDPDAGGALTSTWGDCSDIGAQRCGTRLAVKLNSNTGSEGWLALDEMKGKISFDGLTIKSREITTADNFGGDQNDAGIDGMTVLEIGLPNKIKYENFSYNVVTSSSARPTDAGFTQQIRHGVDFNGSVNMQGNMLIFPTGNP